MSILNSLRKPVGIIVTGGVLVAVGATVLIVRQDSSHNTPLTDASKVLQAVDVTMAPNGDVTKVDGTVVGTTSTHKNFTNKNSYSPSSATSDIPVRILTSYRTSKGSGTDLSKLDGYSGPVQIQFTIQNLTVAPREVHYAVNGRQYTRSAMVGVPMTVVASTDLPDLKPSAVRTTAADDFSATNGVLSRNSSGATQVQWATILAPPQLGSSTTLTLALDAKKFKVPDLDVSVQPGLVTDPSIGALIDNAFNPKASSQMKLEQRTVDLIGDVTTVLSRAGKTISKVRRTLNQSSDELGTQTVADLKDSTTGVTESVKSLTGSVNSLGSSLNSSLKSTRSLTISELRSMVQSVSAMLGDTRARPTATKLTGNGCDVTVAGKPKAAASIYGTLLQVTSQLDAYSSATDQCKTEISNALNDNLTAVDGILDDAQTKLGQVASDLTTAATSIPGQISAISTIDNAVSLVNSLVTAVGVLLPGGSGPSQTTTDYNAATSALADIVTAVNTVHNQAKTAGDDLTTVGTDLAAKICDLAAKGAFDDATAEVLRAYTSTKKCDGSDGPATAPDGKPALETQATALQALAAATDLQPSPPSSGGDLYKAVDAAQTALDDLGDDLQSSGNESTDVSTQAAKVQTAVEAVQSSLTNAADAARQALTTASTAVTDASDSAVHDAKQSTSDQATASQTDLTKMFALSTAGLTSAADQITTDGAKAINAQKKQFAGDAKSAGDNIKKSVTQGLGDISDSVSGSTKDLAAAQRLLTGDLRNVLLDLGTPSVKGSGLLGSMATNSATAGLANYQLALAARKASSYGNVRNGDIAGLMLRQAQTDEALTLESQLPAFRLHLPSSADHHTIYTFHLQAG